MTLQQLIGLAIQLSMALIVFAVALHSPGRNVVHLLREPGLLLRSLLAMNVLMPLVAVAIALAFDLNPAVELAMVAMALAPVPPIVPGKEIKAGGSQSYVLRLLAAAALVSIVFVPAMTALLGHAFGRPVHVGVGTVTKIVVTSVLLPLLLGYGLRRVAPAFAQRIAGPLSITATVLLLVAVVPVLIKVWPALVALADHASLIAIVAFVLIGLAIGHALGGPDPDNRTVLALSTATRHPAVAIAVLHDDPTGQSAMAAVLLVLLVGAVASVPYVKWRSRAHATQSSARRAGHDA